VTNANQNDKLTGGETMTDPDQITPERHVRPWIAALLTFGGWGLGLFYARKTRAAVWWSVASALFGVALAIGLVAYATLTGQLPMALFNTGTFTTIDLIGLIAAALIAVWVWIQTAKKRYVAKGSPARLWGYLGIWLLPVIASFVLAVVIRFTLFQPFRSPSGSMQPTINVGDSFVVTKWSYGYSRLSFAPFDGLFPEGRVLAHSPKRGDIIVFRSQRRDLVKRIVGLPGDRIQLSRGVLSINGVAVQRDDLGTRMYEDPNHAGPWSIPTYRETLPDGGAYLTLDRGPEGRLDHSEEFLVPSDAYFVLGDDRDNSADSRVPEIGFVTFDHIIGRVDHILGQRPKPASDK
jgi:signal peptidase I